MIYSDFLRARAALLYAILGRPAILSSTPVSRWNILCVCRYFNNDFHPLFLLPCSSRTENSARDILHCWPIEGVVDPRSDDHCIDFRTTTCRQFYFKYHRNFLDRLPVPSAATKAMHHANSWNRIFRYLFIRKLVCQSRPPFLRICTQGETALVHTSSFDSFGLWIWK